MTLLNIYMTGVDADEHKRLAAFKGEFVWKISPLKQNKPPHRKFPLR